MPSDNIVVFNRRNRTEAERSIIFAGGLAGSSLWEINERLAQIGARPHHPRSYKHIREAYVPYFLNDMSRLQEAIKHPPSLSVVAAALRADARRVA